MLSVRKHNELLTKQYLIACYLASHSNHHMVMNNSIPCCIRHDFATYKMDITYLNNRGLTVSKQNTAFPTSDDCQDNHGRIQAQLGCKSASITSAHSITRIILAQLRSGWANILNSYRRKIIPRILDCCPLCNQVVVVVE